MSVAPALPVIAILGAGSMGGAILSGLVAPGVVREGDVRVTNRTRAKADALAGPGVQSIALDDTPDGNVRAVDGARVVLVGVKPAMVPDLLREIGPHLTPGTVLVSVAVGVTTRAMEALVPEGVAVVRAMPNTPSLVGLGVTGVAGGASANEDAIALAGDVFRAVGEVIVCGEDQIDALSTISGSGPAYVFLFIEELTKTAERLGFSAGDAATMVQGTFRGASELLAQSAVDPAELRRRVTSPKGTTERAVAVLQDADLGALFDRATAAALARAREIAAE